MRFSFDRTVISRFPGPDRDPARRKNVDQSLTFRPPPASARDTFALVDRVSLTADGQHRRRLGEIDRGDRALGIGGDGDPVAGGVVLETIGLALVAGPGVAMFLSSNPDVDAAAGSERAAV